MTYQYNCLLLKWIDGDTCKVTVDMGFRISYTDSVRIWGINAPELRSPLPPVAEAAKKALAYARKIAPEGEKYRIRSYKSGEEKYGRWLASIKLKGGKDFGEEMIAAGHAISYLPKTPGDIMEDM